MTPRVEIIADDAWAAVVASRLADRIAPGSRLCLATGDTVAPVYALIESLGGSTIFVLDEFGGLPVGDPGRCASMIQRHLLDHVAGDFTLHIPDVDTVDPGAEADRFGELIRNGGIDLAVVGLGRNGHIGMNEPGSTGETVTRVVELAPSTSENASNYGANQPPSWGITVGMAELLEARELWLLVTGGHKSEILHRTLTGPVGSDVPATFLRAHPNCTVFADESAAPQISN